MISSMKKLARKLLLLIAFETLLHTNGCVKLRVFDDLNSQACFASYGSWQNIASMPECEKTGLNIQMFQRQLSMLILLLYLVLKNI